MARVLFFLFFNMFVAVVCSLVFWLRWVFVAVLKLSLVSVNRGDSLVTVHRFLSSVDLFIAEHCLQ